MLLISFYCALRFLLLWYSIGSFEWILAVQCFYWVTLLVLYAFATFRFTRTCFTVLFFLLWPLLVFLWFIWTFFFFLIFWFLIYVIFPSCFFYANESVIKCLILLSHVAILNLVDNRNLPETSSVVFLFCLTWVLFLLAWYGFYVINFPCCCVLLERCCFRLFLVF